MYESKFETMILLTDEKTKHHNNGFFGLIMRAFTSSQKEDLMRNAIHKIVVMLEKNGIEKAIALKINQTIFPLKTMGDDIEEAEKTIAKFIKTNAIKKICLLVKSETINQLITYDICIMPTSDTQATVKVLISGTEQLPPDFYDTGSYIGEINRLAKTGFWNSCEHDFERAVSAFIKHFHINFDVSPRPETKKVIVVGHIARKSNHSRLYSGRHFYPPSTYDRYYSQSPYLYGYDDFFLFYLMNAMSDQYMPPTNYPTTYVDSSGAQITNADVSNIQSDLIDRAPEIEAGYREIDNMPSGHTESPETSSDTFRSEQQVDHDPHFDITDTDPVTATETPSACACVTTESTTPSACDSACACDCSSACDCACACGD